MRLLLALTAVFIASTITAQNPVIVDVQSKDVVPFATISFGDGRGTFASEDGRFAFSRKRYKDIDSLFISSIGYEEKSLSTLKLTDSIFLTPATNQLKEVVVTGAPKGKYKTKKIKPFTHQEINGCWLPTVESELAVSFERYEGKKTKIAALQLPINAEAQYKSKGKAKVPTVYRVNFYYNENGKPGAPILHPDIVFLIPSEADKSFLLEIADENIFIPKNGLFAGIQVLGYADKNGELAQSKKYREIETREGIKKISTAFRPLLPFTNQLSGKKTFVRRVFLNQRKWQVFDENYNENSNLIQGNHRNYGMGAVMHVYQE